MVGISSKKAVYIVSEPINNRIIGSPYIFRAGNSPDEKNPFIMRKTDLRRIGQEGNTVFASGSVLYKIALII